MKKEVETERRITEPEEIQQAHGPSDLAAPRKGKRVAYFMLPNRLREKLGATDAKKKVEIGAAALETAENSIKDMEGEYLQWVDTSIDSLTESLTELTRGGIGVAQHVANINNLAHELLSQGGIFDYPLVTGIGKSLYMATLDPDMDISENKLKLFSAHVDTIRAGLTNKIKGDGGSVGLALLSDIETAIKRYR